MENSNTPQSDQVASESSTLESKQRINIWKVTTIFFALLSIVLGYLVYRQFPQVEIDIDTSVNMDESEQVVVSSQMPLGCFTAVSLADEYVGSLTTGSSQHVDPEAMRTLKDLPIYITFDNSNTYVGYKSNLVGIYETQKKEKVVAEAFAEDLAQKKLLPDMKKAGYELVRKSISTNPDRKAIASYNGSTGGLDVSYIFKNDTGLFEVKVFDPNDPNSIEKVKPDVGVIGEYYCAEDISEQKKQYAQLLTMPGLVYFEAKMPRVTILSFSDDAYQLDVGSMDQMGGSYHYVAHINGAFVSLWKGQEETRCEILEKYKVGRGFSCNDFNTGQTGGQERTVVY